MLFNASLPPDSYHYVRAWSVVRAGLFEAVEHGVDLVVVRDVLCE